MARITVEDCVKIVSNRFELCLIAANRAKSILSGAQTGFNKKEKPAVIALREIGGSSIDVDVIRSNIIAGIKNRNLNEDIFKSSGQTTEEMIVEEIQSQALKDATFVSENIQVDD